MSTPWRLGYAVLANHKTVGAKKGEGEGEGQIWKTCWQVWAADLKAAIPWKLRLCQEIVT